MREGVVNRHAVVTTLLVTLASQASAADLGARAYDPGQAWSWTGCYLGANAGGLWGDSDRWIPRTPGGAFEGVSLGGHSVDGFIGGVQGGCDYQTASGIVIGVAGDYGWTNADGTHLSARETGVFYHSDVEALASITGRLGYAFGRALLYVEGGAAWELVDYRASTTMIGTAYRASDDRPGWTIGGGGEYAFTDRLSAFVEYSHYDFGTERITLNPQFSFLPTAFVDIDDIDNVIRAGINLRIGRR
jgi:outer membrane immunogenic protein